MSTDWEAAALKPKGNLGLGDDLCYQLHRLVDYLAQEYGLAPIEAAALIRIEAEDTLRELTVDRKEWLDDNP